MDEVGAEEEVEGLGAVREKHPLEVAIYFARSL